MIEEERKFNKTSKIYKMPDVDIMNDGEHEARKEGENEEW